MLSFLFKKSDKHERDRQLNSLCRKFKSLYNADEITEERKVYLETLIRKHGYLPYPHIKALEELSPAETLFGLRIKWELNGVCFDGRFNFADKDLSPVVRANYSNSDWIKKEQHSIKLINLAGLGDGNKSHEVGSFIDWLKQILILPSGNVKKGVLGTTVYLIPFHPREFGCAYLPTSASVSENLEDHNVKEITGLNAKEQVKLFVELAQLAGHPVLYDLLPQTGRYSKVVLSNPHVARWFDVKFLIDELEAAVEDISLEISEDYDEEDIEITKNIYKKNLRTGSDELNDLYKVIYEKIDKALNAKKKYLSNKMLSKSEQVKLHRRVKDLIAKVHNVKPSKISEEDHITNQAQTIQTLISEGLWPAPGGAWCSSGIPIFDKMSECGGFPLFRHYDNKGADVSHFANLDCQTPYYYFHLDSKEYNYNVIETLSKRIQKRQKFYNFDGLRIDHVDHIVDEYSEQDSLPISYRIPRAVLKSTNAAVKNVCPRCASMAEYMLGGDYLNEYHKDMGFDVLWGDDIIAQSKKTPEEIIENNQKLHDYNAKTLGHRCLSILKTYNNQDGEFREIDQYPGQLGENGALFKWFKLKFLPGGKLAQRPVMYVDGDESFTEKGIESTIISEISLPRAKNYEFFYKFDAINRFALNNELTREGEAQIVVQEADGFCSWMVSKDPLKEVLLIVANYLPPTEKVSEKNEEGVDIKTIKEGIPVLNKSLELPGDFRVVSEIVYDDEVKDFVEKEFESESKTLQFPKLEPSEFKIYSLTR